MSTGATAASDQHHQRRRLPPAEADPATRARAPAAPADRGGHQPGTRDQHQRPRPGRDRASSVGAVTDRRPDSADARRPGSRAPPASRASTTRRRSAAAAPPARRAPAPAASASGGSPGPPGCSSSTSRPSRSGSDRPGPGSPASSSSSCGWSTSAGQPRQQQHRRHDGDDQGAAEGDRAAAAWPAPPRNDQHGDAASAQRSGTKAAMTASSRPAPQQARQLARPPVQAEGAQPGEHDQRQQHGAAARCPAGRWRRRPSSGGSSA